MKKIYKCTGVDHRARAGEIVTDHGTVLTPVFMPVGTRASVKGLWQEELLELNIEILLGNTYHLLLRPGHQLIEEVAGGLHNFMNWNRPILTDSGGYQVFSLSKFNKITDEGVAFKSHLDGSSHFIGPRESMDIQKALGSDIAMVFDDCPALPCPPSNLLKSVKRTLGWARICRDYPLREYQHLFGIIQGGLDLSLRTEMMGQLYAMNFEGLAIGGLSVGEKNEQMRDFLEQFVPTMPRELPRYLMGVGTPLDILHGIKCGLDMFDCVIPTRNARNGQAFTRFGTLSIKKERFKRDGDAIDPDCSCKVCKSYSRSYIRHLYNVGEYLAGQLLTFHNLYFYKQMMIEARECILNQTFDGYYHTFYNCFNQNRWNS